MDVPLEDGKSEFSLINSIIHTYLKVHASCLRQIATCNEFLQINENKKISSFDTRSNI